MNPTSVKFAAFRRSVIFSHKQWKGTPNGRTIAMKRYALKDGGGVPKENMEEIFFRVANCVARGHDATATDKYFSMLVNGRFMPNSPTFTGADTPLGQLAACFVLPIKDDMGREKAGIMSTLRNAALIQQTGGGNGFDFSELRQKGARVESSGGESSGPIDFMTVYDQAFGVIAQGGTRRGANMAVLRVDHPDIRNFVTCKASEKSITNFNISVGITDKFMVAVREDSDFELVAPHTKEVVEKVRARELFDLIVKHAHNNGEPGVLFLDAANRDNPVPHLYELKATNPCGEQWLGPYENCCLGSINLANHVLPNNTIDWTLLRATCATATEFLDGVIEANKYVPAVPQLKKAAFASRRIGLGIMGLADVLYRLGVPYGSLRAQELSGRIMEFVRYNAMCTSILLGKRHGSFTALKGSIYDKDNFRWTPPKRRDVGVTEDFGCPPCMWSNVEADIRKYGIRNSCITTIAPTGTIATVAGCEGYGCEPVFGLVYKRHVNDNGKDLVLTYVSPLFGKALEDAGITGEEKRIIIEKVEATGSCQKVLEVPKEIRDVFVVSADISPKEHVDMQAALQALVDNSISKTCNLPTGATESDVATCYMRAWELGCKGLTVYVTGSRSVVVLETNESAEKKQEIPDNLGHREARPKVLPGTTIYVDTPVGKVFVTINERDGVPFEVIINSAKSGSEVAAMSEALGRLASTVLRGCTKAIAREKLVEVMDQLSGIGGRRSVGLGVNRIESLPDGVASAIQVYLENLDEETHANGAPTINSSLAGDICPDCGNPSFVKQEGCKKCFLCDYSEC